MPPDREHAAHHAPTRHARARARIHRRPFEVRYFVSSIVPDAPRLAQAVRGHWGIENSLHWVLDISFNEDQSRIRKDHGPANFALLRRMAISLMTKDTSKGSLRKKRKRAAWSEHALLNMLAAVS